MVGSRRSWGTHQYAIHVFMGNARLMHDWPHLFEKTWLKLAGELGESV